MILKGFPSVIIKDQQYNFGGKPTVILYTDINHHVWTPKQKNIRTLSGMSLEVQCTWTKSSTRLQ